MEKIKCPICDCKECKDAIIDLMQCDFCGHIFKKEMLDIKHMDYDLHLFQTPLEDVRKHSEKLGKDELRSYVFPSLVLYGIEISPNDFYCDKYNHFFNQMSLTLLLSRSGLKIYKQENTWNGSIPFTKIEVMKNG